MKALQNARLLAIRRGEGATELSCTVSTGERVAIRMEGVLTLRMDGLPAGARIGEARHISDLDLVRAAMRRLSPYLDETVMATGPLSFLALRGARNGHLVGLSRTLAVLPELTGL